jgi:hypothetical protein
MDSTGRDAVEQGFDVTFVSDAVATFTMEMHRATIEQNWPRYAHHVLTADEVLSALGGDIAAASGKLSSTWPPEGTCCVVKSAGQALPTSGTRKPCGSQRCFPTNNRQAPCPPRAERLP